jgi:hypothetical protein
LFLPENICSSESLRPKIDGEDNAQSGYEKIVIGTNKRTKKKKRTNEQTNKQTNKQTNERKKQKSIKMQKMRKKHIEKRKTIDLLGNTYAETNLDNIGNERTKV